MSFFEFQERFTTEEQAINYFLQVRYQDKVTCPHCGSHTVHRRKTSKNFDCSGCGNTFSIFRDTIFEKSSTDLRKWFYAIHLFLNGKKGISGLQLQREIGVTYKTAWRMLRLIREAIGNGDEALFMNSIIEIDETYVGSSDDEDDDTPPKHGRGTSKPTVIGILDCTNGKVQARVIVKNEDRQKLTGRQILEVVKQSCGSNNTIITDCFKGYNILDSEDGNLHLTIDHSKEYSDDNGTHINNIEGFWGALKRGIYGIYHHVSEKYVQHYINEFCFRYNNRDNRNVFDTLLGRCVLGG